MFPSEYKTQLEVQNTTWSTKHNGKYKPQREVTKHNVKYKHLITSLSEVLALAFRDTSAKETTSRVTN